MATVAELLAKSRLAHLRYLAAQAVNTAGPGEAPIWVNGPMADQVAAIREARQHRHAAHLQDRDHQDPDWRTDRAAHDDLEAFYQAFLAANP